MTPTAGILRLFHLQERSQANGPGWRAAIWVQGCDLGCPGCFNPQTHALTGGTDASIAELAQQIVSIKDIEGITISGGEPLQQAPALAEFLCLLRQLSNLSILMFTGYTWSEIQVDPEKRKAVSFCDVLLAGRYVARRRVASGLIGSDNKSVHLLTNRYTAADLRAVPVAEIIITKNGEIISSGIDPIASKNFA